MAKNRKPKSSNELMIRVLFSLVFVSVANIGAVFAQSGVSGSKHDLSTNESIVGGFGVCSFCHGPHTTIETIAPLWERSDVLTTFTLYGSDTINAEVNEPGVNSLICLSCHDGVTAFDALNGSTGTTDNDMTHVFPGSPAIIGSNLSNDHPIGVSTLDDSEGIKNVSEITGAGLLLFEGRVECASCHDAHGNDGYLPFLRTDNDSSNLCMSCHIK